MGKGVKNVDEAEVEKNLLSHKTVFGKVKVGPSSHM